MEKGSKKQELIPHFTPTRIYCHEAAKDFPVTNRINKYWTNVEKSVYSSKSELDEIEFLPNTGSGGLFGVAKHNHNAGRSILVIKKDPGQIVVQEPAREGVVSMNVYRENNGQVFDVKLGSNCSFRCHYCYLYGAHPKNVELSVYVNTNLMKAQMRQAVINAKSKPVLFNAGEHTDSLALDPVTRLTSELVPLIPSLDNAKMELRTKSDGISNLEKLKHGGQTIVAWSIAPQAVIDLTEGENAISFQRRLDAMVKVQKWGYPVAIKIDPIVPINNWKSEYSQAIKEMKTKLNPKLVHHFAVGVIRMGGKLKKIIDAIYPDMILNKLDYSESHHGKATHPLGTREQIYKHIIGQMNDAIPNLKYYISMEDEQVAEGIMKEMKESR